MIPRKRLQVLLYTLHIFYVFGDGGPSTANMAIINSDNSTGASDDISPSENIIYSTKTIDYTERIPTNDHKVPRRLTLTRNLTVPYVIDGLTINKNNSVHVSPSSAFLPSSGFKRNREKSTSPKLVGIFSVQDNAINDIPAVKNLTVSSLEYALNVTWDVPEETKFIENYHVKAWYDGHDVTSNISNKHAILRDLKSCTEYKIEVIPVDNSSNLVTSASTSVLASTDGVPGPASNLITLSGESWIQLTWDEPTVNPECVSYYSIEICQSKICHLTNVSATMYNVTDLNPCLEYSFTITVIGDSGSSDGISTSVETSYVLPGEPQALTVEPGDFSLLVSWQMPLVGTTCIKHYRITVWDTITEFATDTKITMTGLYACAPYTVQVTTVSIKNDDSPFVLGHQTTAQTVTDPPLLLHTPWVSASTVSIGWYVESLMNNCTLKSVITVCNYTSTDGHGYTLVNGESTDIITTGHNITVNVTVYNLSPFTNYNCKGITVNSAGNSDLGLAVPVITSEDIPSSPVLDVFNIADFYFTFTWTEPEYLPGYLNNYEIIFTWEPLFLVPDWCVDNALTRGNISDIDGSSTNYVYSNGVPYSNYTAKIRAKTGAGWGKYSDLIEFYSKASVPGPVSRLTYSNTTNANDSNILDTALTWGLPCSLNGRIDYFHISVYGTRDGFGKHTFTCVKNITEGVSNNDIFTIDFGELFAEYRYIFNVSAKVVGINDLGATINYTVLYPAGIPSQPADEYIKSITIDPYKAQRTTSTAAILLPLFPNTNGNIQYYAIMISEAGFNEASHTRFDVNSGIWPNTTAWHESMLQSFIIPYQATTTYWNPYSTNHVADYGHIQAVKFTLGEDATCKELSPNTNTILYCNGPLKADTWYHIRMRAFTNGGYADSVVFVAKTDAELNVALVIGVVFAILSLGIMTTMMLLVRRSSLQAVLRRFLHSDMPGSPVPAPFTRRKFIIHCQQLADNPGKLSNEFQLLQTLSVDLQMPANAACLQANRKKNRYSDILPYDFSRVKLEVIDNDPNTDYINASFIRGATGEDEYIACQGPKEETTYDFWRMIDQYDVKIIVMLTQLVEKGKEKCHQYFPTIKETFTYENMAIRCISELDFRSYTQRTLALQKEHEKRNITHLHFKDWPDHDVPEDFDLMINFCQVMRRQISANKGLAVIHCSAGIGRTGTLIALDILLQHIRDNRKLDVFGTVYRLRHHRINMVQRESQYAYIYNCIRQVLKNPYFLKTYKPPPVEPIYENVSKKNKETSNSNTNLVSSLETLRKSSLSTSIDSMEPIYKSSPQPTLKTQSSTFNNGMRCSKSASAITIRSHHTHIGQYGSHDYPIYESVKDSTSTSSKESTDKDDPYGSRSSIYENLPPLTRSRSDHAFNRNVYTYTMQKSLEKDESV